MRSRLIAIGACVAVLAVAVLAHLATWEIEESQYGSDRYVQHEKDAWLEDLSEEDREDASSLSIDPGTFASHLPVVSIDTNGQEVPGERVSGQGEGSERQYTLAADGRETIATDFSLFAREGAANRLTDDPTFSSGAELRYRGNSSRLFDKKSYAVSFTLDDRMTSNDYDVLGMGEDNDWVLNGPFLDKTLIRNYLSMNIAGQIMSYAPDVRFCELFVNGEYQGVYLLMERVKYGESRVALTESDPQSAETSYIVQRDWTDLTNEANLDNLVYATGRASALEVIYPPQSEITQEQMDWIRSDVNYIEKCLYSYDYDTDPYGYWSLIDVDSFVDYAIINEFSANVDAGKYSTYFYRDVRGLLSAGPVWDFNNAYNNYFEDDLSELGFFTPSRTLYFMLYKDDDFVEQVIDRYRSLRESVLSDEHLQEFIDESIAYLGPAIERNYQVWGYSFDPDNLDSDNSLLPAERNPTSFDEAVEDLRAFIRSRGSWLDHNIENLRQYSHESVNKRYNH